jgi:hypothetical protein
VASAQTTFSDFIRDPDMKWIQNNLGRAKGVLIAPEVLKAGFIVGGSGGRAVLYGRDKDGPMGRPGVLQPGCGERRLPGWRSSVANRDAGDDGQGLQQAPFRLGQAGGDASVAVARSAPANAAVLADFVAFSRSKGLYGGLNLEGSVVSPANDWNNAYYAGRCCRPTSWSATKCVTRKAISSLPISAARRRTADLSSARPDPRHHFCVTTPVDT